METKDLFAEFDAPQMTWEQFEAYKAQNPTKSTQDFPSGWGQLDGTGLWT